jgi:hypothetical protein
MHINDSNCKKNGHKVDTRNHKSLVINNVAGFLNRGSRVRVPAPIRSEVVDSQCFTYKETALYIALVL